MIRGNQTQRLLPRPCIKIVKSIFCLKFQRQKRDKRSSSKDPNTKTKFPLTKQKPSHYLYGSLNAQDFVTKLVSRGISDAKVETGQDGGFPVQIHLAQEETLIQVVGDQTHVLYDQVGNYMGSHAVQTSCLTM